MFNFDDEEAWLSYFDFLAENDFLVLDNQLLEKEVLELKNDLLKRKEEDAFKQAGIGTLNEFQIAKSIRGDKISWLKPSEATGALKDFFLSVDELIRMLNRYCFLSLSGFEFHYAHYPSGTFYKRHLDQFSSRNNRMISLIVYLNTGWAKGDGGELAIYFDDKTEIIEPIGGRVVIFKSDVLEHEVLLSDKDRYTLTGWLTRLPPSISFLDL